MSNDLTSRRSEAAEAAWQDYDLDGAVVGATSGWEHDTHSAQVTRAIYVEDFGDPEGHSVKGHVNVDFVAPDSDVVTGIEVYVNGLSLGRPGGTAPSP